MRSCGRKKGPRATGIHTATSLLECGRILGGAHHMEEQRQEVLVWEETKKEQKRWRSYSNGLRQVEQRRSMSELRMTGTLAAKYGGGLRRGGLEQLEDEDERGRSTYAGGRRKKHSGGLGCCGCEDGEASSREVTPFLWGGERERVEEWLEGSHDAGDKAAATEKAYGSMWQKWKAWGNRQGWAVTLSELQGRQRWRMRIRSLGFLGLPWMARLFVGYVETSPLRDQGCP